MSTVESQHRSAVGPETVKQLPVVVLVLRLASRFPGYSAEIVPPLAFSGELSVARIIHGIGRQLTV
jgi:hypothetical protein